VRKENGPTIADPLMKVDGAVSRFGGEVGRCVVNSEGHAAFLLSLVFEYSSNYLGIASKAT
jgi:hypothetical protein